MDQRKLLLLEDVAYCPSLLTTLVSLRQLLKKGFYWDTRHKPTAIRRNDGSPGCKIQDIHGQFVLEYRPLRNHSDSTYSSAFTTHKINSRTQRSTKWGTASQWHLRLGHPGPQALEHFVLASQGVKIQGIPTVECISCGKSKLTRQIRRTPRENDEKEGERIAIDFHDYQPGIGGYTSQMLLTCRKTNYIWDYYLSERTASAIVIIFRDFLHMLLTQHDIRVKKIECDNEITTVKPAVQAFLHYYGIVLEPSAPYTQAQNGAAERSGGVIKTKERTMREEAKLPSSLWPEIGKAAVYLNNRIPSRVLDWKSPYEVFQSAIAKKRRIPQPDKRPNQAHLKVYGCRAFAMTTDAHKKANRLDRLAPRAWLGYLVGYQSSNIYRIWIPHLGRIISTRDVRFNEKEVFQGDIDSLRDDIRTSTLEEIAELSRRVELKEPDVTMENEFEDCVYEGVPPLADDPDLGEETMEEESREQEEILTLSIRSFHHIQLPRQHLQFSLLIQRKKLLQSSNLHRIIPTKEPQFHGNQLS